MREAQLPHLQEALSHGFLSRTTDELGNRCGLASFGLRTLDKPENCETKDE